MKLSKYLENNFNKKKYGFGNIFAKAHLEAIQEFEEKEDIIFLKMSEHYYMFNTKKAKFSIKTDKKGHTVIDYHKGVSVVYDIGYYNFRKLYKVIKEFLYKN